MTEREVSNLTVSKTEEGSPIGIGLKERFDEDQADPTGTIVSVMIMMKLVNLAFTYICQE